MSAVIARRAAGTARLADLLAIPEESRHHELIEGEIVEKEAASARHGGVQLALGASLFGPFNRRPGGRYPGGWLFATEVDVYFDSENTVRPDNVGWRRERLSTLPITAPIEILPDWICEVLSTNRRNDLVRKKRLYHRHKIPFNWIIDPIDETLLVYRWAEDGYVEVLTALRGERVRAEPFEAIELSVGVFFGDQDDDEP